MTIFREPGSTIVGQYSTPIRGTWNSLAIHAISQDALYDSLNVFLRRGKVRNRPGLSLVNPTIFDGPILGGAMAVTPVEKRLVVLSKSSTYELGPHDTAWTQANTGTFALTDASVIDTAFMETSGAYHMLVASQGFTLKGWNSLLHTTNEITPQPGSDPIPLASSVCVAVRRVICLVPPHTVRWSKVFTIDNFPPLAFNKVAQTNDAGICVKALTSTAFILYKERSIYVVRAREGNDDSAFQFGDPIRVEGPAGVKAVVAVEGLHIYMTKNGRIAQFDGSGYPQWICDGLWLFLQDDIDPIFSHLIHGVYDYRLHTITFYYPKKGDASALKGMVIISLPLEGADIQGAQPVPAAFKGISGVPCSHGCEVRFQGIVDRSMIFSSTPVDPQSFYADEEANSDDGEVFECSIHHPLIPMPDAKHAKTSFEVFVERGQGYGMMRAYPLASDNLEGVDGRLFEGKVEYIDLETNPVQNISAFNISTRFVGIRYEWDSSSTVRYSGSVIYRSNR